MASKIASSPLLRTITVRGYSGSCSPSFQTIRAVTDVDVNSSVLENKLTVAAVDNRAAVQRVSIIFRAGSKYETFDNKGAAHMLRIAAGLSTKNASQFGITRNLQQLGTSLTCTGDREIIAYTLTGTPEEMEQALPFLSEVATQQCFKPWEVSDNFYRVTLELAQRTPEVRIVDLLHKAAFRGTGLGNSLFMPKHKIGSMSSETLQLYTNCTHTSNRAAVVGVGMDLQQLCNFAGGLKLSMENGLDSATTYKGSEIRLDKGGETAYVGVALQGAKHTDAKHALACKVLRYILGTGPYCKWGKGASSLFTKALGDVDPAVTVRAFNVSYTETGLIGALIACPSGSAREIVTKVAQTLKNPSISDQDVARGKAQAKTAWLLRMENADNAVLDIGSQAVNLGSIANAKLIGAAIDGLSKEDIMAAAQKAKSSPLTLVSRGNLRCVPYLDELK